MTQNQGSNAGQSGGLDAGAILRGLCPSCHNGKIMRNFYTVRKKCPNCAYNFYPEPGFYLGAMAVSYLLTAMLTIPPVVVLKFMQVDIKLLIAFPLIEFLFLGTFLMFYARIVWLHVEHRMTQRLDGNQKQ